VGAEQQDTSVIIITLLISLGGLIAYSSMPKELYPEIVMPQIYVRTCIPATRPLDIENLSPARHRERDKAE
jgi:multidrug efflux pump